MLSATQALNIIAEIKDRPELDRRLAAIAAAPNSNPWFRPSTLPDTHFTRFVIIEDPELPALLCWESNHDGYRTDYLLEVAQHAPEIDRVLECCTGYPGSHDPAWLDWMRAHSYRTNAFYCAYRGIPRKQVVNDRKVHDALRTIVDRDRDELSKLPKREIHRELQKRVRAEYPELDLSPQSDGELRWKVSKAIAYLLAALVAIPAAIVFLPWLRALRRHEEADIAIAYTRPVHDDAHHAAVEDRFRQNQLTHVVDIKPGFFRAFTMWFTLVVIDAMASVHYVRGHLGGIESIHFGRWVIVRDRWSTKQRDRLVFFSNYDGSWDAYLGEFIDRQPEGLTAVWSNTKGFPRSKNLLYEGAADEEAFKQWTRDHQIPTQVWWTGVPDASVQNVCDDIWIRRRLVRDLSDEELPVWLNKL